MRSRLRLRRPFLTLLLLMFMAACSSRGCATCVGYTPELKVAALEHVTLAIEHKTESTNNGAAYGPLLASFSISNDPNEVCKEMAATTTLSWNGVRTQPTRTGGGQNFWCSRAEAYTLCGAVEGTFANTSALLGALASPSGGDRFEVEDGSGKLAMLVSAGRPRVEVLPAESKELAIAIVFDGLSGSIANISPCAVLEKTASTTGCTPLAVVATSGNRARVRFSEKTQSGGDWLMLGTVKLLPSAACTPAKTTCKASVSYPLRVPFKVP